MSSHMTQEPCAYGFCIERRAVGVLIRDCLLPCLRSQIV